MELSREFRVRFKRSCLKKKELLYKLNNIEVGVISELKAEDEVSVAVFLTNYGSKDIQGIKLKILNPANNEVKC